MIQLLLAGFYLAFAMMTPILDTHIVKIGWFQFMSGQLTLFATLAIIDVINQHWGSRAAKEAVGSALIIRAIFYLAIIPLFMLLPAEFDMGGGKLFAQSFRNFISLTLTTFLVRFFITIPLFTRMKSWFSVKYNVTGLAFVIISGVLSPTLKYYGVAGVDIPSLIITGMLVKGAITIAGTPFATGLNWIVTKTKKYDHQL